MMGSFDLQHQFTTHILLPLGIVKCPSNNAHFKISPVVVSNQGTFCLLFFTYYALRHSTLLMYHFHKLQQRSIPSRTQLFFLELYHIYLHRGAEPKQCSSSRRIRFYFLTTRGPKVTYSIVALTKTGLLLETEVKHKVAKNHSTRGPLANGL